jgi:hypothetical protein
MRNVDLFEWHRIKTVSYEPFEPGNQVSGYLFVHRVIYFFVSLPRNHVA